MPENGCRSPRLIPIYVILVSMPTGAVTEPTTALGTRLREKRIQSGLTQTELAERLGYRGGANRVSDWEIGKHIPSLPLLERICAVYGMSVSGLLQKVM